MQDVFEEVRHQIHEIRNIIGPVNLKLADMEYRIAHNKDLIEEKTGRLESQILAARFRLDKQDIKIADILARVTSLEQRPG